MFEPKPVQRPSKKKGDAPSNPVIQLLEELCSKHQISLDQFVDHLSDPSQFLAQEWAQMEEFRQKLESDLNCTLENISNPATTANKYKELEQARRWIFVR